MDAGKSPPLYKIEDLKQKEVPGYFYRQQLTKTEEPEPGKFLRIEYIVKRKTEKGQKKALVKYLHYPHKFDKWLPLEDVLINEDDD